MSQEEAGNYRTHNWENSPKAQIGLEILAALRSCLYHFDDQFSMVVNGEAEYFDDDLVAMNRVARSLTESIAEISFLTSKRRVEMAPF